LFNKKETDQQKANPQEYEEEEDGHDNGASHAEAFRRLLRRLEKGTDEGHNDKPNQEGTTNPNMGIEWGKNFSNKMPEKNVRNQQNPSLPFDPKAHQHNGEHLEEGPGDPKIGEAARQLP
jgi:hypothetical protein